MTAANTTAKSLQNTLANKLKGIVKNPVVTVIVAEVTNNKVYIFGGGVKSGVYSLWRSAPRCCSCSARSRMPGRPT